MKQYKEKKSYNTLVTRHWIEWHSVSQTTMTSCCQNKSYVVFWFTVGCSDLGNTLTKRTQLYDILRCGVNIPGVSETRVKLKLPWNVTLEQYKTLTPRAFTKVSRNANKTNKLVIDLWERPNKDTHICFETFLNTLVILLRQIYF